eukprot:1195353-Prorocentrum_minimum.AAC.2
MPAAAVVRSVPAPLIELWTLLRVSLSESAPPPVGDETAALTGRRRDADGAPTGRRRDADGAPTGR